MATESENKETATAENNEKHCVFQPFVQKTLKIIVFFHI